MTTAIKEPQQLTYEQAAEQWAELAIGMVEGDVASTSELAATVTHLAFVLGRTAGDFHEDVSRLKSRKSLVGELDWMQRSFEEGAAMMNSKDIIDVHELESKRDAEIRKVKKKYGAQIEEAFRRNQIAYEKAKRLQGQYSSSRQRDTEKELADTARPDIREDLAAADDIGGVSELQAARDAVQRRCADGAELERKVEYCKARMERNDATAEADLRTAQSQLAGWQGQRKRLASLERAREKAVHNARARVAKAKSQAIDWRNAQLSIDTR